MMYTMAVVASMPYWLPGEQAERERAARRAQLVAEAGSARERTTPASPRRRSLVPRLAGALGLF